MISSSFISCSLAYPTVTGNEDSEELYESIYEVIRQPSSESDFEEIQDDGDEEEDREEKTSNLSKIAEAAGRKMKKLKTNWSMKKNDITRSLSRIKRTNRPMVGESEARRKVGRRVSAGGGAGGLQGGLGLELPDDDTMFYITLTIEEVGHHQLSIFNPPSPGGQGTYQHHHG